MHQNFIFFLNEEENGYENQYFMSIKQAHLEKDFFKVKDQNDKDVISTK